jgi:hypothetical protein
VPRQFNCSQHHNPTRILTAHRRRTIGVRCR